MTEVLTRAAAILCLFAAASCAEPPAIAQAPSALIGGPPGHTPDPWGGKASVYARIDAIVISGHGTYQDFIEVRMTILDERRPTCVHVTTLLNRQPESVRSAMVALATTSFVNRYSIGISPPERGRRRTTADQSALIDIGQMTAGEPLLGLPEATCPAVP